MSPCLLPLLLLTASCASPAPEFFGAERSAVRQDGIEFVVFHKGERAEVVRRGYLGPKDRAGVQEAMILAAEQATGCAVLPGSLRTGIPGDTGEARMALRC